MIKTLKFIIIITAIYSTSYGEELTAGKEYKIIKPVYLSVWYDDLGNKTISKETARGYLGATKNADRPYIAFQSLVPANTIMTIVGIAPKPWYYYFFADDYFVRLDPDLSQGLDIILQLDRGIEGSLDGLNPEIFSRVQEN